MKLTIEKQNWMTQRNSIRRKRRTEITNKLSNNYEGEHKLLEMEELGGVWKHSINRHSISNSVSIEFRLKFKSIFEMSFRIISKQRNVFSWNTRSICLWWFSFLFNGFGLALSQVKHEKNNNNNNKIQQIRKKKLRKQTRTKYDNKNLWCVRKFFFRWFLFK